MKTPRPITAILAGLAMLLGSILVLGGVATPGYADPNDPDGPNATLQDKLATAAAAYADAKDKLDSARRKQVELTAQLAQTQQQLADLTEATAHIAVAAYRSGPVGTLNTLLNSVSPDEFVSRASTLQELTRVQSKQLRSLKEFRVKAAEERGALDQVIAQAQVQATETQRRKAMAEQALAVVAGGPTSGVVIPAPAAEPAPRNPDGSFPAESCSVKDPTTSGCLTPRTLHAYQQVRAFGFNRYAACFRQATWGEHPKGRACDFAADVSSFGGVATGASRDYGNRLAGWLIANADRLGVLYVIWFRQIWMPGTGWRAYSLVDGSPSGDHTNHVHLSIR